MTSTLTFTPESYETSAEFAFKAKLYKTARAVISCAKFKAGEFVAIRFNHRCSDGCVWFHVTATERGPLAEHEQVGYPAHHLTDYCL